MGFFKSLFSKYEPPVELLRSVAKSGAKRIMDVFYEYSYGGTRSLEDRCFMHVESSYWSAGTYLLYFSFWNCNSRTAGWEYKPGEALTDALPKSEFWSALPSYLRTECQKYIDTHFPADSCASVSVSSSHWDSTSVSDDEKYLGITVSFTCRGRY